MLKVIACVKYLRSDNNTSNQKLGNNYYINQYDLYMLELLVKLKKHIPCYLVSVTMGPIGCAESLNIGIALGLDDAYLISDPIFAGSDTFATSYILMKALEHIGGADIYAFGEKSTDGETGQVPIGVASRINQYCIMGVKNINAVENGVITIEQQFTNHINTVKVSAPSILCFKGFTIEEPEISLFELKKALKYSPIILNADSLNIDKQHCGQSGSKTIVEKIIHTVRKRDFELIEGRPEQKAGALTDLIFGSRSNDC